MYLNQEKGKDDQDSPAGVFKHINSDTIIAEPYPSLAGGQRMDRNPHGHSQLLAHWLLCGGEHLIELAVGSPLSLQLHSYSLAPWVWYSSNGLSRSCKYLSRLGAKESVMSARSIF